MRSLLIIAARRGRASRDARQLDVVERLYCRKAGAGDGREIAHFALKHGLTTYDATSISPSRSTRPAARHARQAARRGGDGRRRSRSWGRARPDPPALPAGQPRPTPVGRRARCRSRRAIELDALSAVLPLGGRDRLAELFSEGEVETLRHLAREGIGANTLRAMASDLAYLEAWSLAASGAPLPWPAPQGLVLRFVAHHLYDPVRRAEDPRTACPTRSRRRCARRAIAGRRSARAFDGAPAPGPVGTFHRWLGLEGPFSSPNLRGAVRLAARAARRPRGRKSARPLTRDVLDQLIATCDGVGLADKRDAALLLLAFASGGRRRSEIARLRFEDLVERPPVRREFG